MIRLVLRYGLPLWVGSGCGTGADPRPGEASFGSGLGTLPTGAGTATGTATDDASGDASSGGNAAGDESTSGASGADNTGDPTLCESTTFQFSGTEYAVELPSGARFLHVKAWGAGGNHDDNRCPTRSPEMGAGGVGGYSEAVFPVSGAEVFTVVVGEYGSVGNERSQGDIGFGGGRGGGLSGVFTGSTPLAEGDQSRAWLIAGGGGAAASTSCAPGTPGNHPDAGGQLTMQGEVLRGAGGGGGYQGGSASTDEGSSGGTGFVAQHATLHAMDWAETGVPTPPRMDDEDYIVGTAGPEKNGHVKLYIYCSEGEVPPVE